MTKQLNELPSRYNPKDTEDKWSQDWEKNHTFHAEPNADKKPFTVVMPPPNITGILHMGHALNNTLQDIIVRYKRMKGFETLWMPGTDHAGIATQNVVEKQLAKEGKRRQDVGREEFVKRLWAWRQEYGDTIIHQLKKLGSSCDWDRTRFTMDDAYSEAVKLVFVTLYEKDLIYRGHRIINWCPRCQTALSDEEAEHHEIKGALYHIRYPLKENPQESIVVATTRPETMLGDTAVAVNPKDKRYKKLIGKTLILPLLNREIKIIADQLVDPKFGTGAVKVTPAHDPNDFTMGKRHNLQFINIMHPDAKLNEQAGPFAGLDRFVARKKIIEALTSAGLLEKIEDHMHAVGHCYRCNTIVEPYLSYQWFVKMEPLAAPAIKAVKTGKIKFFPNRWTKVYLNWMTNIQDWCISRQIWWGHRIPVWYCKQCQEGKNIIVAMTPPKNCPHCHSNNLIQDEDVLDTWFSSWLWPFATLYWPQKNKDLDYFYPTSTLFTAPEIIFFWVARMIMAGLEFMKDIPFAHVYIHGTVRDAKGQKMSKSLGNAIDPLEIINDYGADALRFSLILNSGQDLFISKEKFEIGRNFANKIWNATRLILMNTPPDFDFEKEFAQLKLKDLDIEARWIISRFYTTLDAITKAVEKYRFSEAETLIYEFFWGNFCDWYLEIIKDTIAKPSTQAVALSVLEQTIRLMHPFLPFITEEIWHILKPSEKESLSRQPWPKMQKKIVSKEIEAKMQTFVELVSTLRNLRIQWNIPQQESINVIFTSSDKISLEFVSLMTNHLKRFAKIADLKMDSKTTSMREAAIGIVDQIKFFIPLQGLIDIPKEKERIQKQFEDNNTALQALASRLDNSDFLKKAPSDVIEKDRIRLAALQNKRDEFQKILKSLA